METILPAIAFWTFSGCLILTALLVVINRHPVAAALSLVAAMFCAAGLMVQMQAFFLGVIQLLVYAGAVMVLFLFIIMLLNLKQEEQSKRPWLGVFGGIVAAVSVLASFLMVIWSDPISKAVLPEAGVREIVGLGRLLYGVYGLPLEATGLLLLSAIVGVIVLCAVPKIKSDSGTSSK